MVSMGGRLLKPLSRKELAFYTRLWDDAETGPALRWLRTVTPRFYGVYRPGHIIHTPAAKGEDAAAATGGGVGDGGGCGAEAGGRTKAAAALPPSSASVEVAADGWMLPFDDVATAVPDTVLEGMQAAAAAAVSSMEGPGGGVDDVALPSMFDEDIDHLYRVPEVDMMFSGMGAGHPKSELVDVALMAEGL